jgi:hypothetical protein
MLFSGIWKYATGGLAFLCLMLFIGLQVEKRRLGSCQEHSAKLTAKLHEISTKRDEQKTETGRNIIIADKGRKTADTIAKRIEAAPLPGQCATPREILGADL